MSKSTTSTHPLRSYIPKSGAPGGYIPRKIGDKTDMEILKTAYKNRWPVLIKGETGTGKTISIQELAYQEQVPYIRMNLNGGTTPEDLLGEFVPDGKGGFVWQDGFLKQWLTHGGFFVADEMNMAPAEILTILNPVLDFGRLVLKNEVVDAHPDFWFVSTMNEGYEGTKPLNNSLPDRFPVQLEYTYDDEVEKKLIKNTSIREVAAKLRKMYKKGEVTTPVSTRALQQFDSNTKAFGEDLAVEFFLNKFHSEEKKVIESVLELTFKGRTKNALIED